MKGSRWIGGLLGMAFGTALAQTPAPAPAPAPDGWVIALAWSPQYCKQHLGTKEPQCQDEHYFELAGFAPRFEPGHAQPECEDARLPKELLQRALVTLPNQELLKKLWRRQGGCSGLAAGEYVLQLERAARRLTVPEEYRRVVREPLATTLADFKAAFVRENPGLEAEQLMPKCRGAWLEEVRFCVDADFAFGRCPIDAEATCPERFRLRPARASRDQD